MLEMLKSLLNEIKKNGLFPMFSHRNIVIVGFIVLITYLFGIDHYPTNISIETGITIFLISYISGALYIALWSAIISLGWGVFYLVNKYTPSKNMFARNDWRDIKNRPSRPRRKETQSHLCISISRLPHILDEMVDVNIGNYCLHSCIWRNSAADIRNKNTKQTWIPCAL